MSLNFHKMQAQGNDFVILDGVNHALPSMDTAFIQHICHRKLGIGCDQLLVLEKHAIADALMLIYNADGSQAANCGNGLRCVGSLLMQKCAKTAVTIALADRIVQVKQTEMGIRVNMGQASLEYVGDDYSDVCIGNPHRVYFQQPQTCLQRNVEIISDWSEHHAHIRIIERGTGETLACGSGACATATAIWQKTQRKAPLTIHMPGGDVLVSADGDDVCLEGSVRHVFSGVWQ